MLFTNIFEHTIKCVAAHDLGCSITDNFRIDRIRKISFTLDAERLSDIYISPSSRSKLYEVTASVTQPAGPDHQIALKFIVPPVSRNKFYQFQATKDRYVGVWRIMATEDTPTYENIDPTTRLPRVVPSVQNPMGDWRMRDKKVFDLAYAAKTHVPVEKVLMTKAELLVDLGRASARFGRPDYNPDAEHDPAPVITNYQTDLADAIEVLMQPATSLIWADTVEDESWDESPESPKSMSSSAYFTESNESNSLTNSQLSLPPLTGDISSRLSLSPQPYTPSPEPLSAGPQIRGGFPTGLRVQVTMTPISETPEPTPTPQSPHVGPEQNSEPSLSVSSDMSTFNLLEAPSSRGISPTSHAQSLEHGNVATTWLPPAGETGTFIEGIEANPELEDADIATEATALLESPLTHRIEGGSLDDYVTHIDLMLSPEPSSAGHEIPEATGSINSSSNYGGEDPEATTGVTADEFYQRTTPLKLFREQFPQADRTTTTVLTIQSTPRGKRIKETLTVDEVESAQDTPSVVLAPVTPPREADLVPTVPPSVRRQGAAVQELMNQYRAVVDSATPTLPIDVLSLPREDSPQALTTGTIVTADLTFAGAIKAVPTAGESAGIETKPHEAQPTQPMQFTESDLDPVHKRNGSYDSGTTSVNTETPASRVVRMPIRPQADNTVIRRRRLTAESGPVISSKLSDVFGPEDIARMNEPLSVIASNEAGKGAEESMREEFESEPVTVIKKDKGKGRAQVVTPLVPPATYGGNDCGLDTAEGTHKKYDESMSEFIAKSQSNPIVLSWQEDATAAREAAGRPGEGGGQPKRSDTSQDAYTQTSPTVSARSSRARASTTTEGVGTTTVTIGDDSNTTYVTHIGTFNCYNYY